MFFLNRCSPGNEYNDLLLEFWTWHMFLLWNQNKIWCELIWWCGLRLNFDLPYFFSWGAFNLNQSCRDDFFVMGFGFCHVIQVQSSSGFYFLAAKIFVSWLVGRGQLGGMTESLRYLSYSREASPIGPPTSQGLLYGLLGTQLEGRSSFLMGKRRLLLFCRTNKLHWKITIHFSFHGINHLGIRSFLLVLLCRVSLISAPFLHTYR